MKIRLVTLAALSALSTGGLLAAAAPAMAQPPIQQGWWTVTTVSGLPAAVPPPAPDVPAKGLLVQGGLQAPTAYAALVYDIAARRVANRLTLKVSGASVPGAALQLCRLRDTTIIAEQGGSLDNAPKYTCATTSKAKPDAKGNYTFRVAKLASNNMLAVAILPADPATRVALAQPGPRSLTTLVRLPHTVPPPPPPTTEPDTDETAPPSTGDSGTPPIDTGGFAGAPGLSSGSGLPADVPQPVPSVAPTPVGAAPTAPDFSAAALTDDGDGPSPQAVLLALAAVAAIAILWGYAGSGRLDEPSSEA